MDARDSLVMDDDLRSKGNVSTDEALLVMHFLEHAHNAHSYPPKGNLKIALRGGGDMDARRRRGGGVGEMWFRVGPFVLCKNRCWRQRHRNTKFGPKAFFTPINSPATFE